MQRLLAGFLLVGCATGGTMRPGSDATPQQSTMFTGESGTLMTDPVRASTADLSAAPDVVWDAVKAVYKDLEIPVTVDNPTAHQLGNASFAKSRTMGGSRMSEFINCGTSMTGPNADSWRIDMSLLTDVQPTTTGSTVRVTLKAQGKDVSAGSSYLVPCGTTGRLESLVISRVQSASKQP